MKRITSGSRRCPRSASASSRRGLRSSNRSVFSRIVRDHSTVAVTSRPWRGYEDVRAIQGLALEVRRLEGPRAPWHVGDLAWGFRSHANREHEWRIRLWEEEDAVIAW